MCREKWLNILLDVLKHVTSHSWNWQFFVSKSRTVIYAKYWLILWNIAIEDVFVSFGKMLYSCFPCDWMRNVIRSNCCKQEVQRFLKSVSESLLKGAKFVCFSIVRDSSINRTVISVEAWRIITLLNNISILAITTVTLPQSIQIRDLIYSSAGLKIN